MSFSGVGRRGAAARWLRALLLTAATGCSYTNVVDDDDGSGGTVVIEEGCSAPASPCDGGCVDLRNDPANCGACDEQCAAAEICADGVCAIVCAGGTTRCGDDCVDTNSDRDHCGACDVACDAADVCIEGDCVPFCDPEEALCGTQCVDPLTDPENCGDCGVACDGITQCSEGKCIVECDPGLAACDGVCVDTSNDPDHCGGCGDACGPGLGCDGGICECPVGATSCAGECVDLSSNPQHCTACDTACPAEQLCLDGTCGGVVSAWQTLGYDARRSGHNPLEVGVPPLTLAWTVGVGVQDLGPAVIESNRVFVTSPDVYFDAVLPPLQALDLGTGNQLWTHSFGDVFAVGQPTVSDGKVYVQHCNHASDTGLWQLDASSGAVGWFAPHSAQWETYWAPVILGNGVFVNGGSYGGLYGFSTSTANQLFFNDDLEQYDEWGPAAADGLVFTFVEGALRAHSPSTGAIQWLTVVPWNWSGWSMKTAPVFDQTRAFVVAPPSIFEIDVQTHALEWTVMDDFHGMPAVADGLVFALSGGELVVLDAADGSIEWTFSGDGELAYQPVIAAGHVYVASADNVYAVDLSTHAEVWTDSFGGWLSIASGKLMVARATGTLAAYSLTF